MAINIGSAIAYLELDTSKFTSGFARAKQDLKVFGDSTATTEQKARGLQSAFRTVGSTLTKSVTLPIVAVGTAAVKVGADFEAGMSQVAATMGKPKSEIQELTEFAKEMGRTTAFSATEAAGGLNILAMSGLDATQQMQALPTVLNLASAGNLSLADSATYVTATVKGFGDSMENATYYSDLMAKGATLANTDVGRLGEALSGASANVAMYGQSAESTTLSLLRLAESNITGSEATTMLNRVMVDLYGASGKAKAKLDELGVSLYDSQGNARDFNDVVDDLDNALSGMSEQERIATEQLIFSKFGMEGFNKLTSVTTETVKNFKKGLQEAGGSAAKQAQEQLNNLKGDMKLFTSALEGAGIAISDTLLPMLRGFVQGLTGLVTKFNELSPEIQDKIVKFALLAAAIGPVMLIISKLIGVFLALKSAIAIIGSGLKILVTAISGIGLPILAVVAVIAVLVGAFKHLWDTNEEFRNAIIEIWGNIKETVSNFINGLKERFTDMGITVESLKEVFSNVTSFISSAWDAMCSLLAPVFVAAFDVIQIVIETATGIITGFVDIVRGIMTGDWATIWQGVKEVVKAVMDGIADLLVLSINTIVTWIATTVAHIVSWGMNMVSNARSAMTNFVNVVKSTIQNLPQIVSSVVNRIPQIISSLGSALYSAGRGAFQRLLDGIKSIASSIISYVSSLASRISGAIGGLGGKVAGIISGSHANGLDYVPFDGYIAELHEGERVLTKQEAKAYNEGRGVSGGGDVYNFYNTKPTPYEYARQMKRAKKELAYNF